MIIEELIDKLKEYPSDMEVYLSVDNTNGLCRSVSEDMDYCVFLSDEEYMDYNIGLTDNLELVKFYEE